MDTAEEREMVETGLQPSNFVFSDRMKRSKGGSFGVRFTGVRFTYLAAVAEKS